MTDDLDKQANKTSSHIKPLTGEAGIGTSGSEKKIAVHVMPKRFLVAQPAARKAKSTGLIVLAGGVIVLIAALAFLYFYFLEPGQKLSEEDRIFDQVEVEKEKEPSSQTEGAETDKTTEAAASLADQEQESIEEEEEEEEEDESEDIDSDQATTTIETEPTQTTATPTTFKIAVDSDGDGLADIEEVLFDCNVVAKDSDGDGHEDLVEILNLYNPAGSGKIMVNPNIEKYINSKYNYSLYYPYAWAVEEVGGEDSIIFNLGHNQFIQVITQPNTKKQNIEEWYKDQLGVDIIKNEQRLYKQGWQGVKSEDGLVVYLTKTNSEYIIVLSHNLGVSNLLNYKNVFAMIAESLEMTD